MAEFNNRNGFTWSRETWAQMASIAVVILVAFFGFAKWNIDRTDIAVAALLTKYETARTDQTNRFETFTQSFTSRFETIQASNAAALAAGRERDAEIGSRVAALEANFLDLSRSADRLTNEVAALRVTAEDITAIERQLNQRLDDMVTPPSRKR